MEGLDSLVASYGLAAASAVLLLKSIGLPIPIPGDVLLLGMAAQAAAGRVNLGAAFVVLLLAVFGGGLIQYGLARGPGRSMLYRYGRYVGLGGARLDAAASAVRRRGPIGIGMAVLTPGVRTATIPACGIAAVPVRVFGLGLLLGTLVDLALHFALGYAGGTALDLLGTVPAWPVLLVALLLVGLGAWFLAHRRLRPSASGGQVAAAAFDVWAQATCPACLVVGLVSPAVEATQPVLVGVS